MCVCCNVHALCVSGSVPSSCDTTAAPPLQFISTLCHGLGSPHSVGVGTASQLHPKHVAAAICGVLVCKGARGVVELTCLDIEALLFAFAQGHIHGWVQALQAVNHVQGLRPPIMACFV